MTLTDDEARAKLSPNCLVCAEPLRAWEMAAYIEQCEKRGKDPLAAPKGGILCKRCLWSAILDMSDDDTETTPTPRRRRRPTMQLSDDEERAIDEVARVLRRVAQERGEFAVELFVRADGRANFKTRDKILYCDLVEGGAHPSPGAALRRLVGQ